MRYKLVAFIIPCALALSACPPVTPAYKDNGTRSGACIEGGPDEVAQKFYDYQIQHRNNDLTALRPYLSDDLAKLLNDARCCNRTSSPARQPRPIAPAWPAPRPFQTAMPAISLCASI